MDTTAKRSTATTSHQGSEPVKLKKRIGSTTFTVTVHFSSTNTERLEDKALRLIKADSNT